MRFYTLRTAAKRLGVSHEEVRNRLELLKPILEQQGIELDWLETVGARWPILSDQTLQAIRDKGKLTSVKLHLVESEENLT